MTYYFVAESHTFEFQPKYASEKSSLQLSIHTNSQLKDSCFLFQWWNYHGQLLQFKARGGEKPTTKEIIFLDNDWSTWKKTIPFD